MALWQIYTYSSKRRHILENCSLQRGRFDFVYPPLKLGQQVFMPNSIKAGVCNNSVAGKLLLLIFTWCTFRFKKAYSGFTTQYSPAYPSRTYSRGCITAAVCLNRSLPIMHRTILLTLLCNIMKQNSRFVGHVCCLHCTDLSFCAFLHVQRPGLKRE
jgi:hypothetical protein